MHSMNISKCDLTGPDSGSQFRTPDYINATVCLIYSSRGE